MTNIKQCYSPVSLLLLWVIAILIGTQAGKSRARMDLSDISVGRMSTMSCDLNKGFADNLDVVLLSRSLSALGPVRVYSRGEVRSEAG
jgi:hypothetical protein